MDANTLKNTVVETYGNLAKRAGGGSFAKLFACCDPGENAKLVAQKIGYSPQTIREVPGESNLGVGCGNPSEIAGISAGEIVVDLGSGGGLDAFIVSPMVGVSGKVIGVDLSDEMLKLARKNAQSISLNNVEFVKGDIESLPLESATADVIISNCVINLSQNKSQVFEEAFRVLKPGGRLAISDVVLKKELPAEIKNSVGGHIACISGAEMEITYLSYIQKAGFEEVRIENEKPFPLELMLTDPQVQKLAKKLSFDLESAEASDIASRVSSITVTAIKPS